MSTRRLPALLVLVVLVALAALVDNSVARPKTSARTVAAGGPVSAPAGALSSTWYCVGGSAGAASPADTSFVVANTGTSKRSGSITVVSSQGGNRVAPLTVPPAGRVAVRAQDLMKGPWVAATIELDGGATAASRRRPS